MNVFMQGMRRSGTTIVYDILCQDKNLDLYYEPFAAGRTQVNITIEPQHVPKPCAETAEVSV